MRITGLTSATAVVLVCTVAPWAGEPQTRDVAGRTPQAVVDELLAADRAFSKAGTNTDVITALAAMFSQDVVMLAPGGLVARGAAAAAAALRADSGNATSRAEWTPVRGGISADGQHGFTFGYMTVRRADNSDIYVKYLSYWIEQPEGWRVVAYKRSRATPARPASLEMMPPALPARLVPVSTDTAEIAGYRDSLDAAERAFSAEAQKIGIGPAFARYGSADAINLAPPTQPQVTVGSEAIGRMVSTGVPPDTSPVSWAPESVLVASSGDLGITIGTIRSNTTGPDGKPQQVFPFFTIWRRLSPADPWRYVAE